MDSDREYKRQTQPDSGKIVCGWNEDITTGGCGTEQTVCNIRMNKKIQRKREERPRRQTEREIVRRLQLGVVQCIIKCLKNPFSIINSNNIYKLFHYCNRILGWWCKCTKGLGRYCASTISRLCYSDILVGIVWVTHSRTRSLGSSSRILRQNRSSRCNGYGVTLWHSMLHRMFDMRPSLSAFTLAFIVRQCQWRK